MLDQVDRDADAMAAIARQFALSELARPSRLLGLRGSTHAIPRAVSFDAY
jgi:hypothetical protein